MRQIPRPLPLALAAAAALGLIAACAGKKPEEPVRTRLLVVGESDAKVPPDAAVVVLSVVTQSRGALDAQRQNARKSEAVINAVKGVEGANPEVQTSDYALDPQRDYDSRMPRIVGYEARNSVRVTTAALDAVGALIDAATAAGANGVDSVNFILRESNQARGRALGEASRQAMSKAEAMAGAMGGRVIRVVEQREGGFPEQQSQEALLEAMHTNALSTAANMSSNANAAPRTPVEAGALNLRSQVYLVVEVEARPR